MVPNSWFRRMMLTVNSAFGLGFLATDKVAVTQITSRTTAVIANAWCGAVTLVSAAGSTTPATLTVNNSNIKAGDLVILNQASGTDLYTLSVSRVVDGAFDITSNTKSGTTTEQPVFNFAIIRTSRTF